MAGMLPGVGVPQRRKNNNNNKENSCRHQSPLMLTERREPSSLVSCIINDLDENTQRARQRLEQKLGYLHPSSPRSGSGELLQHKSSGWNNQIASMKDTRLGSKLLGNRWQLKFRRCKSDRKICSVCLEDFQDEQQIITKLSCSHKYHSDCVLPWLAVHPHCPYCRRPALVS